MMRNGKQVLVLSERSVCEIEWSLLITVDANNFVTLLSQEILATKILSQHDITLVDRGFI